jgi:hypothetical protein
MSHPLASNSACHSRPLNSVVRLCNVWLQTYTQAIAKHQYTARAWKSAPQKCMDSVRTHMYKYTADDLLSPTPWVSSSMGLIVCLLFEMSRNVAATACINNSPTIPIPSPISFGKASRGPQRQPRFTGLAHVCPPLLPLPIGLKSIFPYRCVLHAT